MKKRLPKLYLLLVFIFLALMSLPAGPVNALRQGVVSLFTPLWNKVASIKKNLSEYSFQKDNTSFSAHNEELLQMTLENSLLKNEIVHLKNGIQQELRLLNQLTTIAEGNNKADDTAHLLKTRHRMELQNILSLQLKAIPARVIFRSPTIWSSSLWIDVGALTNESLQAEVIVKNSPVLIGTCVVGVIDYVGKEQSRVRLITDSGLNPSVRVLRTASEAPLIVEKIYNLIHLLEKQKNILANAKESDKLIRLLEKTALNLSSDSSGTYLAKGVLHGDSKPLWRTKRHALKGTCFNYDFADGEGPARSLHTNHSLSTSQDKRTTPIIKTGDLLVTTGMDGVFPPDLLVAQVTEVFPLKEGDYYYEISALPTAGNLDELSLLFVIPPMKYNPNY